MPASKKTILQVATILFEELGERKAKYILSRIVKETSGNSSYNKTVKSLETKLLISPLKSTT